MGFYLHSLTRLKEEYENRSSFTYFGRETFRLRLFADVYEVCLYFDDLLERMKKGPIVIDEYELDFLYWADPKTWKKNENHFIDKTGYTKYLYVKQKETSYSESFSNKMFDAFGERQNNIDRGKFINAVNSVCSLSETVSPFEIDLAIEKNLQHLQSTLVEINNVRENSRWKDADFIVMYKDLYSVSSANESFLNNVNNEHQRWLKKNVCKPSIEELKQRRIELLLELFGCKFLDNLRESLHVPAKDDLGFSDFEGDDLMPDLKTALKYYAAFKKLCPYNNGVFRFDEYATLGKYIYFHQIDIEICKEFFRFISLIDIVQQEMEWIEHPESRPIDVEENIKMFVNCVQQIMLKAEDRNGEIITYIDNHQVTVEYTYNVDGKGFNEVMKEILEKHPEQVQEYLYEKSKNAILGVSSVCPFIGYVISLNLFNDSNLRNKDMEFAFQFVMGEKNENGKKKSFVQKMSEYANIKDKEIFKTIASLKNEGK